MKVFATKYALSIGIEEFEADWNENVPSMVTKKSDRWHACSYHGEGRDWHRTREAAVKRANAMRVKKIASLKKQIDKLEAQAFK
jgi:hypothetical protein